ncbi:unnamed protein product [Orchesella dallaii]|uniref:Uncharacterized protein n=1 Tax=Orchesella dallaii TaxID=48710 RepID=A0ABP1Q7G0_9HEXA
MSLKVELHQLLRKQCGTNDFKSSTMSKFFIFSEGSMRWMNNFERVLRYSFFKFIVPCIPTRRELLIIFVTFGILYALNPNKNGQPQQPQPQGGQMVTSTSDSLPLLINGTTASQTYDVISDDIDFLKYTVLQQQYKLNSCIRKNEEYVLLENKLTRLRKGYNKASEKHRTLVNRFVFLFKRLKQDNFLISKSLVWNWLTFFVSFALSCLIAVIVYYKFYYLDS